MSIELKLPAELMYYLDKCLTDIDSIAGEALSAGGVKLKEQVASGLSTSLAKERKFPKRSTGELRGALGVSPMRNLNGVYDVRIGFREPRRVQPLGGVGLKRRGGGRYYVATNAMVANILEHGHRGSNGGQAAAPYFRKGINAGKTDALDAMTQVVGRHLKEIFK